MKHKLFTLLVLLALLLALLPVQPAHAFGNLYAKPVASGSGDCSSWANACTLQTALSASRGTEIWVAMGTHRPTTSTLDRDATFQLKNSVAVYGGFKGTETARDQRDPAASVTVLSGDIDHNDSQTPIITNITTVTGNGTNSYHVVTGVTGATLDGVTITAGFAGGAYPNNFGGGMYNTNSNPVLTNVTFSGNAATTGGGMHNENSNPTLTNVTFNSNAAQFGGGMENDSNSSPTLNNVTFSGNVATGNGIGGGMRNWHSSNPTLVNVIFSNNSAIYGGGMINSSSNPVLTNVIFSGNMATNQGGGMYNDSSSPTLTNITFSDNTAEDGGGMGNRESSPTLTNVTFRGNSADYGGGMHNTTSSNPTLTNVTFSGNSATNQGGGMANKFTSNPQIRNTIFWGNTAATGAQIYNSNSTPVVSDSVVQDGCPAGSTCTNIITGDPLLGTLGDNGGFTLTIPILAGSSAIDATANNCPSTDQRGAIRSTPNCDIGAYEVQDIILAAPGGETSGLCQSWAEACELRYALTSAVSGQEIWVAAGTHKPTSGTDRNSTFQLVSGVAVYGGCDGTETTRSQRNPLMHVTTLSGEIGAAGNGDNSYHVVTGANVATLDGFTITAGHADGSGTNDRGGGMYNIFGHSPTLANLIFNGNSADFGGGGMFNNVNSNPTLTNVTFSNNSVTGSGGGGGMFNYTASPTLINVTFSGNSSSDHGGGMYNYSNSNPTLTNVTFSGNLAANRGGGMYNTSGSNPALTNVTFSDNSATNKGGGMYNASTSHPTLQNTLIANSANGGDCANEAGGALNAASSHNLIEDSANACGLANSVNGNIVGLDPKLDVLANNGGITETHALLTGSPALDAGNDDVCPDIDQRGVARPQGNHCDIGAFELVHLLFLPLVLR